MGDNMNSGSGDNFKTIKEFADGLGLSYEAIRRKIQLIESSDNNVLKGHIDTRYFGNKKNLRYLDEEAQRILRETAPVKKTGAPADKISELKEEIEDLRKQHIIENQKNENEKSELRKKIAILEKDNYELAKERNGLYVQLAQAKDDLFKSERFHTQQIFLLTDKLTTKKTFGQRLKEAFSRKEPSHE